MNPTTDTVKVIQRAMSQFIRDHGELPPYLKIDNDLESIALYDATEVLDTDAVLEIGMRPGIPYGLVIKMPEHEADKLRDMAAKGEDHGSLPDMLKNLLYNPAAIVGRPYMRTNIPAQTIAALCNALHSSAQLTGRLIPQALQDTVYAPDALVDQGVILDMVLVPDHDTERCAAFAGKPCYETRLYLAEKNVETTARVYATQLGIDVLTHHMRVVAGGMRDRLLGASSDRNITFKLLDEIAEPDEPSDGDLYKDEAGTIWLFIDGELACTENWGVRCQSTDQMTYVGHHNHFKQEWSCE